MKKTCGVWLAVYVLLALGTGLIAYRRMPEPATAWPAAIFGGGFAWMAALYFAGIGMKIAKARMIRRGLGGATPDDGEKIAAIGRISPVGGSAMDSPLSKTPAIAYKYEIRQGVGNDDFTWYEGFALSPSVIQGRMRNIKLLAWGDLAESWKWIPAETAYPNAEEYIQQTEFRAPTAANIRATIQQSMDIYKDDDGSVRWDQLGTWTKSSSPNLKVAADREQVIRPGDVVCVIGQYSAARGGIVPSDHPITDPVSIEVGEEDAFARRANRGAVGYFIGGLIFSAIYLGGMLALHAFVPLEASEQQNPSMVASWPEIRLERILDREVRPRMLQMGMLSANSGELSILLREGTANGRVKAAGRDVVVSRATFTRNDDDRTITIDGDALVLTIDGKRQPRRLTLFGRDIPTSEVDVHIQGSSDQVLTGRVAAASDDAACRVTFKAKSR